MADRSTITTTTTRVQHVCRPLGRAQENGPHLADLRQFVQACVGLPDDARVQIDDGHLGESGRRDVTISVHYRHPDQPADETERRAHLIIGNLDVEPYVACWAEVEPGRVCPLPVGPDLVCPTHGQRLAPVGETERQER